MERFPDNARVVFLGDSLVCQNQYLPRIIEFYKTNFPESNILFFNCGTAGGTAEFALKTFERDVLTIKPTHVVVAFGINDSGRWFLDYKDRKLKYDTMFNLYNKFKLCISELCNKIIKNDIELILCTPAPYDEYSKGDNYEPVLKGGYALMSEYANYVKTLAKENNYILCDYYSEMIKLMQTETLIKPDRVHPSEHGYYRMSEIFLKFQGLKPFEEAPIPEYLSNWRKAVNDYRIIYCVECMIIHKPELSVEEKIQIAKDYANSDSKNAWFKKIAREYIDIIKNEQQLFENVNYIYERDILNDTGKN